MTQGMSELVVRGSWLRAGGRTYRCAIGKGGFSTHKKEGDGATPVGVFPLRACWYRADKVALPRTDLPLFVIEQHDGWSDDPKDPHYNQRVLLPYAYSHEKLWRDDAVYDLIVPIGYNDAPVVAGAGSAIFMHVAKPGYEPTEGCVALAREDLLEVLEHLSASSHIDIQPA
jgi:L,D-peptidoglycan transpeptidase YkuD (ErfK/YbiS/YcfS/YnhG family)